MAVRSIDDLARRLDLREGEVEPYGSLKAKLRLSVLQRLASRPNGRLVLVTAISPTPAGEGKTTVAIGLAQEMHHIGVNAVTALREPSLGPVFGMKGGGTGGGKAHLVPADEINFHFTGDLHAITAANNLLAALIDNHLYWGNALEIDPTTITWKRCLDVNDRALREVVTAAGGKQGVTRETGFEITAASEVMAVLSLAESPEDLTTRLSRVVIGSTRDGAPVTAAQLEASGAMAALLHDALKPNLVQTAEGTPAVVHGGPFGNIAHGCSSVLATRMALKLGAVCITEAGFGADLGAEKFVHIKTQQSGLTPDLAVVVATVRALKMHGGVARDARDVENVAAVETGFANLARHAENLRRFGLPVVVAINRFPTDTEGELQALTRLCEASGLPAATADVWSAGGAGAEELARLVVAGLEQPAAVRPLYSAGMPLREKIETVAREVYRAGAVQFLPPATAGLDYLEQHGFGHLPVCMAKTQYSFSDDPKLVNAPTGHTLTVRDVRLCTGAGFVVAYAGTVLTMPGLPRRPAAADIRLRPDGTIEGLS